MLAYYSSIVLNTPLDAYYSQKNPSRPTHGYKWTGFLITTNFVEVDYPGSLEIAVAAFARVIIKSLSNVMVIIHAVSICTFTPWRLTFEGSCNYEGSWMVMFCMCRLGSLIPTSLCEFLSCACNWCQQCHALVLYTLSLLTMLLVLTSLFVTLHYRAVEYILYVCTFNSCTLHHLPCYSVCLQRLVSPKFTMLV